MSAEQHRHVVAIDGPAAAGKSTVARLLAERLAALLFDTGSLYRALTLAAIRAGVDPGDEAALVALATGARIDLAPPTVQDGRLADVLLNGEDVTWAIRAPEVDAIVSRVSGHRDVRNALLQHQRRIAAAGPVVMVGRDIGTVVVPDAGVKIFLDASDVERARRRHAELGARGEGVSLDQVLEDIRRRDEIDSNRAVAPLRAADDAIRLGTDGKSIELVVQDLQRIVQHRWTPDLETVRE
ncbi:MAG: (d)CMP kinase [Thermomicrobiales bacterium]